jgi:quercetin dioxygenase-like cupin family protein
MNDFPSFMKNPVNMVDPSSQFTPGIEGYVFDGVDGSQMAFWTYGETATSEEHRHTYEEYIVVVQGQYDLFINGKVVRLRAGDEYVIPQNTNHGGEILAGTRAIYAFGGNRAKRVGKL